MKYIPIIITSIVLMLSGCTQPTPIEGKEIMMNPKSQEEWRDSIRALHDMQKQCYDSLSKKEKKLVDDSKRRIDLCVEHLREIGVSMCEFKHEHGRWPTEDDLHECGILKEGQKIETLEGVSISFNPVSSQLITLCEHPKLPFLPTSPKVGAYYNGTHGHGVNLNQIYKDMYSD